jgi:hypothetical protein
MRLLKGICKGQSYLQADGCKKSYISLRGLFRSGRRGFVEELRDCDGRAKNIKSLGVLYWGGM